MDKNNEKLFEVLRQKRNEIAKQKNIVPFKVLHNSVLRQVAATKPQNKDELLAIKGLGPKKVAAYGQTILEIVSQTSSESPPKPPQEKIFSVAEFIQHLNLLLTPERAIVLGEVGRVNSRNGYLFFILKDKEVDAVVNCFIRRHQLENSGVELIDGLEIKVSGYPRIYERTGSFTFEVERISLLGEGALKQAFEKLKLKLEKLGYFAYERKRPILPFTTSVGLITSQFADAKTDFLKHLGKFGFKIYFYDIRVAGIYAADEIVSAIKHLNETNFNLDVLVLTRGGGSFENLQAFNTESVAKAIFSSRIPIITGIGHEADVTIADLVADFRASTPTHAARMLSEPWKQASRAIQVAQRTISASFARAIRDYKEKLTTFQMEILRRFRRIQNYLVAAEQNLINLFAKKLNLTKSLLKEQEAKLDLASPIQRLKQGYSIVFTQSGKIIHSIDQLRIDDIIKVRLFRGTATSQIKEVHDGKSE